MDTKRLNKKPDFNHNIMIVGGGPAGISTWLHLHKYDPELASQAVLIEKEHFPRDKLCGGAIHRWMTDRIFSNLEIELKVPFVPVDNIEIRFEKEDYHYHEENFFRIVRRLEFDYFLTKIAKNRGLHIRENEAFIDADTVDDGLLVQTSRGRYKVKILIGADGALSRVRKKMKPPITPRFAATIEIFSPVNFQFDPEFVSHTAVMDFSPVNESLQGYIWHFPCLCDNTPFMNHGICDTRIYTDEPRADLKKIFTHELLSRHNNSRPNVWSSHPVTYFLKEVPLSQSNVLLVGDAAGIEPLLGGGIHLSLAYGEVASTLISDAFRRNDFSLKMYNQILHNHYLGKYIEKFTSVAKKIYGDKTKILDSLAKIIENKK
jgi:flavin-dependent dehydrogenase